MCNLFSEDLIDEYADVLNQVNLEVSKANSEGLAARRAAGLNERRRAVMCIETGAIYSDMTTAAKALGMHGPSHISTACKTGRKSGGYHWEYYIEN